MTEFVLIVVVTLPSYNIKVFNFYSLTNRKLCINIIVHGISTKHAILASIALQKYKDRLAQRYICWKVSLFIPSFNLMYKHH